MIASAPASINDFAASEVATLPAMSSIPLNDDLISFQSIADIDNTKQTLIEYIWNDSKLPRELPTKHEYDVKDRIADELQNLDRIDSFTVEMKYGVNSISYLFIAKNSNDKLVIYHLKRTESFSLWL